MLGEGGQRGGSGRVVGKRDAVGSQRRLDVRGHLGRVDEQRGPLLRDQQVGQEHRVVVDVPTAEVGQPGDVVQARDNVMRGACATHGRAHMAELVGAVDGGERGPVGENRRVRTTRALRPGNGRQVEVGAQRRAHRRQPLGQPFGTRQRQAVTRHGHGIACADLLDQPADMFRRVRHVQFHQGQAAAGQFGLRLGEVPGIGPHAAAAGGDHQGAGRPGKARKPLPGLPARGQVLGEVRVGRGHDDGGDACVGHGGAQGLETGGDGRIGHFAMVKPRRPHGTFIVPLASGGTLG